MIYADNAATTKVDIDAYEAMKPFLLENYGNASQAYSFARAAKHALKESRETIASCIRANPNEIYFTSGGTESNNWALKSIAIGHGLKCRIVTSSIEHHAVLNTCMALEKMHVLVDYLPVDREGVVQPQYLKDKMGERIDMVSVMYANNEVGSVQRIAELAEIAHKQGALFHTDAVQAVGHIPINVEEIGVDMLSASGHKFNAPKGVGFMYLKNGIDISSYMDGGGQEQGHRAGTENVASIVAMAVALQKNCDRLSIHKEQMKRLEDIVDFSLKQSGIDFIRNGAENRIPGNMSLSFRGKEGEMLLHRLDLMNICVSTGSACDSKNVQVSHVLRAMKIPEEYAKGTIRISFGKDNTEKEAQQIAEALIRVLKTDS